MEMRGFYYWDDLEFNYTATENPVMTDNGLILVVKGDVHISGQETPFLPRAVIPADINMNAG